MVACYRPPIILAWAANTGCHADIFFESMILSQLTRFHISDGGDLNNTGLHNTAGEVGEPIRLVVLLETFT